MWITLYLFYCLCAIKHLYYLFIYYIISIVGRRKCASQREKMCITGGENVHFRFVDKSLSINKEEKMCMIYCG